MFYHPGYYLPLPPEHPFPMDKFPGAYERLRQWRPHWPLVETTPASDEVLGRVHTAAYLRSIAESTLSDYDRNRLGLPAHPDLLGRCRLETGGTVQAVWAALRDGRAANLAGGTHHAMAGQGLGFCVLNDIAVAVSDVQARHPGLRVLVVDTDAHQGNGTHALLRGRSGVFCYDIHCGPNYPSAKVPGDLDVPLPRWVAGEHYLEELRRTLPEAIAQARPDLILWISGADPHLDDRFGQMRLTDADLAERDRTVVALARASGAAVAAVYGGGYNRQRPHTGELHARAVLALGDAA